MLEETRLTGVLHKQAASAIDHREHPITTNNQPEGISSECSLIVMGDDDDEKGAMFWIRGREGKELEGENGKCGACVSIYLHPRALNPFYEIQRDGVNKETH